MKNQKVNTIIGILLIISIITGIIINLNTKKQAKELEQKNEMQSQIIDSFILAEYDVGEEIKVVKATYFATLEDGSVLLETEEGELHIFDGLETNPYGDYRIIFASGDFVGLWEGA